MYSSPGYQNIVPVFTNEILSEYVRLKKAGELTIKLDDGSRVTLSGWTRPENQILYLLEFDHPEDFVQISFGTRICFNIVYSGVDSTVHKVVDEYSREQFYEYIQAYKNDQPSLYKFICDILIWNH